MPKQTKITTPAISHSEAFNSIGLQIDPNVTEICKAFISSTSLTRSVLYILVIINIATIIALVNSTPNNWTLEKLNHIRRYISTNERQIERLSAQRQLHTDSLSHAFRQKIATTKTDMESLTDKFHKDSATTVSNYEWKRKLYENQVTLDMELMKSLIKSKQENSDRINVPIIGSSLDVNDLAIISGAAFVILLVMLSLTLDGELRNLRIAFVNITERYDSDSFEKEYFKEISKLAPPYIETTEVVKIINYKRRRHHFTMLVMNEVFSVPRLSIEDNRLKQTTAGWLIKKYLFIFPYMVYLLVFVNNFATLRLKVFGTIHFLDLLTPFCLMAIAYLSWMCNLKNQTIEARFDQFYYRGCLFIESHHKERPKVFLAFEGLIYFPALLLVGLNHLFNSIFFGRRNK